MEERLNIDYYRRKPKNNLEFFKWVFTEPTKLHKYKKELIFKEKVFYFLKVTFAILMALTLVFFFINFLLDNRMLNLIMSLNEPSLVIPETKDESNTLFINISTFIVTIGALVGFLYTLKFTISKPVLIIGFFITLSTFFYSTDFGIILSAIIILFLTGFSLMYFPIIWGLYTYPMHLINTRYKRSNLVDNAYLKDRYIFFPLSKLNKDLEKDCFSKPKLGYKFINFLLEFRPYQRELAFYLSNVANASLMQSSLLSPKDIEISKTFANNQPTTKFINILEELKDELGKYQTHNNVQFKNASLQNVLILFESLKEEASRETRKWSSYYLKAIDANIVEAKAQIKNLELNIKGIEPITQNVYNVGNALSPNDQSQVFMGRKDMVVQLSNIIYTSIHMPLLLIQGQRRVGKTSLINYLEQLLGRGFKIINLDMQDAMNKRFDFLIKNINQQLNELLEIDEIIKIDDDMLLTWIAFEQYLLKYSSHLNYKIIIAFDEYEAFHEHIVKNYGSIILENMRSFLQKQNQVVFLFSGMLKLSDLVSPNWDEYFPSAQRLQIDYLSKDESLELITSPTKDFKLVYSQEVANKIYGLTMGHPQLLQTVCSNIVNIANSENQRNITNDIVNKAKEQVFQVNDIPMSIFWTEFCKNTERKVIEQILVEDEVTRETIEERRAVARLIDYGFITKEMKIRVPLFEKWLVERRDLIEIEVTRDSLRDERLSKYE